jgi:hypothetical protein
MKMAKPSDNDIDAAGDAMSVLSDVSSGHYPHRDDDECSANHFDEDNPAHIRRFYDLINATLDKSPGWPGRVIGGMCYVILYDKNEIVDPDADVLELHPRFASVAAQRDALLAALEVVQAQCESMATADWRKWEELASSDEFERWAKSRAAHMAVQSRYAIAKVKGGAA